MSNHAKEIEHAHKSNHFFRAVLHVLERVIALFTLFSLVVGMLLEFAAMFGVDYTKLPIDLSHFAEVDIYLHHILTIVVGLEFVRMLIDTTPANILEVLTLAITRHVVLSHEDYWSNVACVACVAGLFAVRRFLVRRSELKEELVEIE